MSVSYIISVLIGYLFGSSNLAYYISRIEKKDIRSSGSGNLGASNAAILLGWKAAIAVGAHDIAKAIVSVLLVQFLFPNSAYVGAVAGVACVLGHIFPFYLNFRGGKGFASYIGMAVALNWKLALVVVVLIVAVTVVTDYIVFGTFSTIVVVPVGLGILTHSMILPLILLVASGVILYKHRDNIVRLHNKTEIGLRSTIKGEKRL